LAFLILVHRGKAGYQRAALVLALAAFLCMLGLEDKVMRYDDRRNAVMILTLRSRAGARTAF